MLGKTAHLLSQLHGKGLVYGDPSPGNIFASDTPDGTEVWLIDADNLRYESTPHEVVFTPGYGAPELAKGVSGVTTLTDAYAFAVIAYQVLTLAHPFIGNLVDQGEPELEERAFAGSLPWIDDPDDDTNRANFGVPRSWVLSPRLADAFGQTFGAGRGKPALRPGMSQWAERLHAAAYSTLECHGCSGTFFLNESTCPWCGQTRPTFARAVFRLWDPDIGPSGGVVRKPKGDSSIPVIVAHGVFSEGQTFVVTRRLALGHSDVRADEPVVSATLAGDRVRLVSVGDHPCSVMSPSGAEETTLTDRGKTVQVYEGKASWLLHFGGRDVRHRCVSFELTRGTGA